MKIPYMENWPALPTPYRTRDWNETARKVTLLSLDAQASYPFFPVSTYFNQDAPASGGYQGPAYGTATYLREENAMAGWGEAVTQLSAVLTAALTEGLDPRNINGKDYVRMAQAYFNRTPDGRGFINNNTPVSDCAGSFWYTLYPTLLFFHLASLYPEDQTLSSQMRETADTWRDALKHIPQWDALGFSLKNQALVTGGHTEPEGILGAAYVLYMAYERFGAENDLEEALRLMREAAARSGNPYYEILGSYGPYLAARMNAERNAGLPLARMLDWVFCDGTDSARGGWGIIRSAWGDYDAYGLSGSLTDTGGYAFAMNTFVTAGALAPVARYAPQYSRAIGQYLTAVASNSHMFFGDGLPLSLQDDGEYVAETGLDYLVYEGVRNKGKTTPFATGDAKSARHPGGTNFSFYSSGPLGLLSSLIHETDVPEILCFDLLKTDFEHEAAYPTYLLYNPLAETRQVAASFADAKEDQVFDAVSGRILGRLENGAIQLALAPDTAVQAVLLPPDAVITQENGRILAGETVIRYADAWVELPEIQESQLLKENRTVHPRLHLPEGDAAASYALSYGGTVIAAGTAWPDALEIDLSILPAGSGALQLTVQTEKGLKLSCSKGVKIFPSGGETIMHYDGQGLSEVLRPKQNCTLELVENGLKFKLSSDWAYFSIPYVELKAEDHPLLLIDVPYVWGGWGLFVSLDGERRYIQGDCAGEGQMLYDLGGLMEAWGVSEGKAVIQPFITTGGGAELIISEITIVKGGARP